MRASERDQYVVEDHPTEDPPTLRARPTWVSSDEDKNLIQKEIILEAMTQNYFSIGRSMKREVQIKLKAVSADHCNIAYTEQKGWCISEKGKDKMSANGTFVFMKSAKQNAEHEPSDLIPIHDGMILSFINYEIRVNLEKRNQKEIDTENQTIMEKSAKFAESAVFAKTMKAAATETAVKHE